MKKVIGIFVFIICLIISGNTSAGIPPEGKYLINNETVLVNTCSVPLTGFLINSMLNSTQSGWFLDHLKGEYNDKEGQIDFRFVSSNYPGWNFILSLSEIDNKSLWLISKTTKNGELICDTLGTYTASRLR